MLPSFKILRNVATKNYFKVENVNSFSDDYAKTLNIWNESFNKNWKKIEWTYKSLDKYLFYQHHRKGKIDLWEDGIFSNFNKQGYQLKNSVTLFNTSHLYNNKNMRDIKHFELHESSASELWKSYSTGL